MQLLIYAMIYLGSALMVFNIVRYCGFLRSMRQLVRRTAKSSGLLHVPLILLILFLVGYLAVGIFGAPNLIIAGILFGGSVFVLLLLILMYRIIERVRANEAALAARYEDMRRELDSLTQDSLAVFRVNLTKDVIEDRAGLDLYDSDLHAESYTELLEKRQAYLLDREDAAGTTLFTREGLLQCFRSGHSSASELALARRSSGRPGFIQLQAALTEQPATGDVVAFITERDYNEAMVRRILLRDALAQQYDMVAYLADGVCTMVTGDPGSPKSGSLLPDSRSADYAQFIREKVAPALCGTPEEQAQVLSALSAEQISAQLSAQNACEVPVVVRVEGETRYKRFLFSVVNRQAGYYLLFLSDTTALHNEQVLQNRMLADALKEAERANEAKTIFLSNMSHDIRTPMNAIVGFTDLARRSSDPAQVHDYLEKIASSSQYLLSLINDVLEMSRIESGKLALTPEDTNLVSAVQAAGDMFLEQMGEKHIRFTVDCAEVQDPWVHCDSIRFDRIIVNLLSNAFKFTPEGGTVTLTLRQTGTMDGIGAYELHVKDSGIGMSEDFAKVVFEAFERERNSTVSGIQGTGLGMAITKSIVDLMQGTIKVDTAPGKGTEFIIDLCFPICPHVAPRDKAKGEDAPETDLHNLHLLLVDDNELNREIAVTLLEEAGFAVDTAINGRDAADMVAHSAPDTFDAVLMDIQMPVMNGYEATAAIRALPDPALANIPILAMTANAFEEDIRAAAEAGMNGHVAKPFSLPKLLDTLRGVLGR